MLGMPPTRSFATRPANRAIDTAPAPAAKPAATDSPAPTLPGTPDSPQGKTEQASAPAAADSAADGRPAEKPKEELSAAEEAKRIARIHRAEARHQEQVAKDRRELDEGRTTLQRERATHADDLKVVQAIRQVRQNPPKSWLGFLRDNFGAPPQAVIDELIAHQQKPAHVQQADTFQAELAKRDQTLAELQRTIQDSTKAQEQARAAEDVRKYKAEQVAPVLADGAKYELTKRALGDRAADEVYSLQATRYQIVQAGKAGRAVAGLTAAQAAALPLLSPVQAADMIEAHFKKQREMLSGTSANPATPPETTKTDEPPRASASGSPAQKPPATPGSFRHFPKPYQRKSVR